MKKLLVSSIVILSSLTLASCSSLDGQYKKSSNDKNVDIFYLKYINLIEELDNL